MLPLKAAIAANRFGLGARPEDEARIGGDSVAWLRQQVATDRPDARTARNAGDRPESAAVLERVTELRLARQAAQAARRNEPIQVDQDAIREYARFISQAYQAQARRSLVDAIVSERPFRERLVRFWENHFAVSADKQPVGAIAGHFRDEAIRPHVSGNFRDLLLAVERHPAMLLYLDNPASIGPNSLLGRRVAQRRGAGLNENLGREILELHTLGVDGGYTQDDVIELSKALTGWSIGGAGGLERLGAMARRLTGSDEGGSPGEFAFRSLVHEPGPKRILGRRFSEDGVAEAESILQFLALEPATARHLATKLARHFVADEPPSELVEGLAKTYLDNDGELGPVYDVLVRYDANWQTPKAKYKTPQEFLISAYRAAGSRPQGNSLVAQATQLGQRPLTPGSPAGWPDLAAHWNSGDALLKRIDWATAFGASIGDRIDAVPRLDEVLGETADAATRTGISRAESGAQALALLFAAPEFQWR
jgi:uncharacterized protein (DUF1800 family)